LLEGFPCHNPNATGNRSRTTKEKAGNARLNRTGACLETWKPQAEPCPAAAFRTAELKTVRGQRFWAVYMAKPGSKSAKEIRVDATSGQILAVQTERPEDQAEEPAKTH